MNKKEILLKQRNAENAPLTDYIGTDGYVWKMIENAMEEYHQDKLKLLGIADVIERFSHLQKVQWEGLQYWVVEDNGDDKVLVANADYAGHPEYNDWWVDRDKLNAL